MRVLIFGGSGMLGHKLVQRWSQRFDTWATLRSNIDEFECIELFDNLRVISGVDASCPDQVRAAIERVQPEAVVNCVGVIKQLAAARTPIACLTLNALLPHQLAEICALKGMRFVHISTDCVFSGGKGNYTEDDVSDANDLYGRTKYLGEVDRPGAITFRTSIIGRELKGSAGLLEWFLANSGGRVKGYTNAVFSGFTTSALADVIGDVLDGWPSLSGVYNLSTAPINKFDLLRLIRDEFNVPVEIEPDGGLRINRSLDSTRFQRATGFVPPTWPAMIDALARDPSPYISWRSSLCSTHLKANAS